jgi:alpha-mannosidase
MSVDRTIILLPGHGLEDLPGQLTGDAAAALLSAWTSSWHPAIVGRVGIPSWYAADQLSFERCGSLLLVCEAARGWLSDDFLHDAEANGATLVESDVERAVVVERLLTAANLTSVIEDGLVRDFLAFGYWYLQTELLSYQLRYTSGLDAGVVGEKIEPAAQAAVQGDAKTARQLLSEAFGMLADQRAHYYPVDSYVLDLTLVAKFNCGEPLRSELNRGHQRNVWLTGETLQHMSEYEPDSLRSLLQAVQDGRAEVVGGEWNELPTSLVSRSALVANLRRGRAAFRRLLGSPPTVFARRRFGLGPVWPSLLSQAGYAGALHATFDDGRTTAKLQARSQWGTGPSVIDAIGQTAVDASLPETALGLGATMGQSMETDFVATVVLARWAGQRTVWLDDLERGLRF